MRRPLLPLLLALAMTACGTDPQGDDAPNVDSAPHQAMTIDVMPLCQTYTWEAKAGQVVRQRVTNRMALLDGIGLDTAYSIETCYGQQNISPVFPCPSGMACSGAQGPTLATPFCTRSHRGGYFSDGKLVISCGRIDQTFDASGAETSHSESSYTGIRVTVY